MGQDRRRSRVILRERQAKWREPGDRVRVVASCADGRRGTVLAGPFRAPCALGRGGVTRAKREGDGATPAGPLPLLSVLYRPDRGPRPLTRLPVGRIAPDSGWCDDPADPAYNRPVRLPYEGRHERLWRDDRLYDVLVVLGWNLAPVRPGRGSAIFLHVAAPGYAPTEGCVALAEPALRALLARARPGTFLDIA